VLPSYISTRRRDPTGQRRFHRLSQGSCGASIFHATAEARDRINPGSTLHTELLGMVVAWKASSWRRDTIAQVQRRAARTSREHLWPACHVLAWLVSKACPGQRDASCMDAALLSWSRAAGDRADVGTASGVLLVVRVCHSRRLDRARRPGPSSPATSGTLRRHAARSVASQLNAWPLAGAAPHASTHPPERNQLDLERTRAPDGGRWSIRRSLPQSGNKFTAPGRTVVS
jgi:hypothetical protein